ncbi:MAG: glycosyltransferase family 2 protein [Hydrogenophilales bacterium]|nr:glycosyltransferase family 2 protein [Hydrogenophilales bacterium]
MFGRNASKARGGLCALLRVRNEQLILGDTLDYLAGLVDHIVAYDDASEDDTGEMLLAHPAVSLVVRNSVWLPGVDDRLCSETRHRGLLLHLAKALHRPQWLLCADVDERIIGDVRPFLFSREAESVSAVRVMLFDAYMTPGDQASYASGPLLDFRRFFGPERRDIVMLWRSSAKDDYLGLDAREPSQVGVNIVTRFHCQHYGKALSTAHWEDTCRYYMAHFPWETYGRKWAERRGKGVRTQSNFDRPLYHWGDRLFKNAVTHF